LGQEGRAGEILNLCFHGIGMPDRTLEPDEENFWITPAQFQEFLDVVVRYPSVHITFDDGNKSDVEFALPQLRQRKLTATFFVISGRLDQRGSLATTDVRDLVQAGMGVGSHGMRHRPWRTVRAEELHEELAGARDAIAQAAGQPVQQVACPFGSYDRRVLRAIRQRGFTRVYTVDGGTARTGAWLQSRYTVRSGDTPAEIERRSRLPHEPALPHATRTAKSLVKRWR
jgi:peptidoglycan/xylan/chitin deacetylase (PgdA/CDA1 family)